MALKTFANVKSLSKVSRVLCRFAPNDLSAVGTKFVACEFLILTFLADIFASYVYAGNSGVVLSTAKRLKMGGISY